MGTQLQQRDKKIPKEAWEGNEGCNELLNVTCPEVLSEIFHAYLTAGADFITTNTSGSFSWVLDEYNIGDRAYELTKAGAMLVKKECEKFSTPEHPRFCLGSIGPGTKLPSLGHITYDEMFDALKERKNGYIVFVMNSPILHIACKDIESAKKMLELALHSGLKASSIKSVSDRRVIVEILTTYKVDAPIGEDEKLFVDDNYLKFLLDYSNTKLKKAREILMRWVNMLDELKK